MLPAQIQSTISVCIYYKGEDNQDFHEVAMKNRRLMDKLSLTLHQHTCYTTLPLSKLLSS